VGLGVKMAMQPRRGETGEAQGEGATPAGVEWRSQTIAQQGSAERIRHQQATFVGDQRSGKVVRNREIQAVCKIAVSCPFTIGTEISDRGFDLDDREITRLAKAQKICATSVSERKLDEGRIAELAKGAADTPRQQCCDR